MKHHGMMIACSAALSIPLAWVGLFGAASSAQQTPALPPPLVQPPEGATSPARTVSVLPDTVDGPELTDELPLGRSYESQSAGISFRPPADCMLADGMSDKYLAEWTDPGHDWMLKLGKIVVDKPTPLTTSTDNFGKPIEGLLEITVKKEKLAIPGGKILRQDVTNTRDVVHGKSKSPEVRDSTGVEIRDNVGLIAMRYTANGQRRLSQQAIIQSDDGVFYLLTLLTPGSKTANDDADAPTTEAAVDPGEAIAVNTFSRMIDSIHILDRKANATDQFERLYRSRMALLTWTPEKLHKVIMNEQWLRIMKDGKDIGYSYITEDQAGGIPRPLKASELQAAQKNQDNAAELRHAPKGDGVLIGVRTGMTTTGMRSNKTKGPIQTDSASWFYVSADKKHEDFSRVVVTDDHIAPKKGYVEEFGVADRRNRRVFVRPNEDKNADPNAISLPADKDNGTLALKDDWHLDVTMVSNVGNASPFNRQPPPWYVPQGMAHLLPRLLPLEHPQGFAFATYVSDVRQVMMRYLDVLPEQDVTFAGQQLRCIPIHDRIGLEGSVTIHYMTIDGNYLGSENKDQKLVLLPTNDTTLRHIWAEANLTRPDAVERGTPQNANAITPR